MKTSALLGGSMLFSGVTLPVMAQNRGELKEVGGPYIHHFPENQILSACQQCNTNCGMKVKLVNGRWPRSTATHTVRGA
jgi:tetrathionate reductase subunit A